MTEKITQQQLTHIVAEVDRLNRDRETELDRQQVLDILQQLNLPPDLLDEAMIQLHRKNALAIQKRKNWWIGLGLVTVLIVGITGTAILFQNHQQHLSRISVSQSRLSLVEDKGENLAVIERQNTPEVYYRVTLQEAPIGNNLSLKCNWIDPSGQIVHQNSYTTRQINTSVWQTHCRHQFGLASMPGTWQVQIFLGERLLSKNAFTVK